MNTTNKDLLVIAESSDALVAAIASSGLQFAFVLEDRFATSVLEVQTNVRYLAANYFAHPNYARNPRTGEPYLLLFGPLVLLSPRYVLLPTSYFLLLTSYFLLLTSY